MKGKVHIPFWKRIRDKFCCIWSEYFAKAYFVPDNFYFEGETIHFLFVYINLANNTIANFNN